MMSKMETNDTIATLYYHPDIHTLYMCKYCVHMLIIINNTSTKMVLKELIHKVSYLALNLLNLLCISTMHASLI